MPALQGRSVGILAGGGRLPVMIAESVVSHGGRVHIVAIEGEADAGIARFPHTWVNWGQIGRMVATLKAEGGEQLVIAGGVRRPDLWKVRPDVGFFTSLPRVVGLLAGGDDSVLTRVVRFFEGRGLKVRGAHEVAPDLLAEAGSIGGIALSEQARADAALGFAVRAALGPLDAGQAVVAADGSVLAIEGAEGTDAMLQRVASLATRSPAGARRGVLAKGPKPGQELRIDMPAIGPRTVEVASRAGLDSIALEAGAVLVLDRSETIEAADAAGIAIHGLPARLASATPAGPVAARTGQVIGRVQPGARDAADIEKGLAAVAALAPYRTGASVVVARAYILAVEAAEGVAALLQRVGALRQWGLGRRIGVLVRRIEQPDDLAATDRLLGLAAAQGLAGVAITGSANLLETWEGATRLADAHGLFLVTCRSDEAVTGTGVPGQS